MKRYITKAIVSVALLAFSMTEVSAQGLRSMYFLDGATFGHQMNPSFMGERNYISLPALGNLNLGVQSNLGLSTFVYKYDNPLYDLTTFLNPSVSDKTFLNKLKDNNKVNVNLNLTLLSFGFHAWGGFNTFELGLRSNTSANLPYELFDFMKKGMKREEGSTYHIKNMGMRSNNYAELALGHARPVNEKLTVGGKLKFLVGGANADAKFDDMYIKMGADEWEVSGYGTLNASLEGAFFETKTPDDKGRKEIDGFDVKSPGIGGIGLGIDLGATYKLRDDLTLSAAILDFGFIGWKSSIRGYNDGTPYSFTGFENIEIEDSGDPGYKSIGDRIDDVADDLEAMIKFYDKEETGKRNTMLATTVNLGAEYVFPYYERLTFGLLSSTRINGFYTWTEARLSANVSPLKWFEASVNYGISNYGSSMGWVLNFHPKGFNFFAGVDYMFTNVTPQYVPINKPNLLASIGFNITFGNGIRKPRPQIRSIRFVTE